MSKRETHLMSIYFIANKGAYNDYKQAKNVANALMNKIEYIKMTRNDYFINAFVGISNLNLRFGYLKYKETRKAGKNRLIIVPKNKYKAMKDKCFEPWHLHILIEANPGETVGELIADYFDKKFKRKIAQKKKIDDGFFDYVLKQSRYQRFIKEIRSTDLVEIDFKRLYERYGKPKTIARKAKDNRSIRNLEKRSWKKHAERLKTKKSLNSLEKFNTKNGYKPTRSKE